MLHRSRVFNYDCNLLVSLVANKGLIFNYAFKHIALEWFISLATTGLCCAKEMCIS